MSILIENWYIILVALVLIAIGIRKVLIFKNTPTEEQIKTVREWLLYAVILAEKELGSGTGKVKLRFVYDLFLSKLSFLASLFTFEDFEKLANEAVAEMKEMLATNKDVKSLVEGE